MERREPEFEDERLRFWRAQRGDAGEFEANPAVLDVDFATEEIFESRVYQVDPVALFALTAEALASNPQIPAWEFAMALDEAIQDASLRILAKRHKDDGKLTFLLTGSFAGRRSLLERHDRVDEAAFREFVSAFEADTVAPGFLAPPTVVTLEEWRTYRQLSDPPGPRGE
jgi:hypothetical protein